MLKENLHFPVHNFPVNLKKMDLSLKNFLIGKNLNFNYKLAFEAYPGFVTRKIVKNSYKSDNKNKNTTERIDNRKKILNRLVNPRNNLREKRYLFEEAI